MTYNLKGQGKELRPAEREIIVSSWKKGKCLRNIGQTVTRLHSTIQEVVNNYKETKKFVSQTQSGRPS